MSIQKEFSEFLTHLYRLVVSMIAMIIVFYVASILFEEGNRLIAYGGPEAVAGMMVYLIAFAIIIIAFSKFVLPIIPPIMTFFSKHSAKIKKLFPKIMSGRAMAPKEEIGLKLKTELEKLKGELIELSKSKGEDAAIKKAIDAEATGLKQSNLEGEFSSGSISMEDAAVLETIFIGKIRDKLETLPMEIMTPWGAEKIDRWNITKPYTESTKHIDETSRIVYTGIIYTYKKKKLFGRGEKKSINVVGAYVVAVDLGRVGRELIFIQADLRDLLKVIDNISRTVRNISSATRGERVFTLIGLASPTGWSERAVRYVRGDGGPSLITRDMVVILIDLLENKIYYPESAKTYSEQWARLFLVETNIEEEARIEKTIMDMCDEAKAGSPMEPMFLYSDLRERLKNISPISLSRVLNRLIGRKIIELRKGEEEHLIICKGRR